MRCMWDIRCLLHVHQILLAFYWIWNGTVHTNHLMSFSSFLFTSTFLAFIAHSLGSAAAADSKSLSLFIFSLIWYAFHFVLRSPNVFFHCKLINLLVIHTLILMCTWFLYVRMCKIGYTAAAKWCWTWATVRLNKFLFYTYITCLCIV